MARITTWRDLRVWQKAHELVLLTYQLTGSFPVDERYGLTAQMRRAAVSVASNIVEGFRRQTVKDSLHFYNTADASLEELKYQYLLAGDLRYILEIDLVKVRELYDQVGKLLYAWAKSQRQNVKA